MADIPLKPASVIYLTEHWTDTSRCGVLCDCLISCSPMPAFVHRRYGAAASSTPAQHARHQRAHRCCSPTLSMSFKKASPRVNSAFASRRPQPRPDVPASPHGAGRMPWRCPTGDGSQRRSVAASIAAISRWQSQLIGCESTHARLRRYWMHVTMGQRCGRSPNRRERRPGYRRRLQGPRDGSASLHWGKRILQQSTS